MRKNSLNAVLAAVAVLALLVFAYGASNGWFRGPEGPAGPQGESGSEVEADNAGTLSADANDPSDAGEPDEEENDTVGNITANGSGTGTGSALLVYQSADSLDYFGMSNAPDPARQPVFPDVPYGNRPALVAYESPFEDGDFCDNTPCNVDIPQFYYRVMTAGEVTIPGLEVSCVATDTKGCLVIVINHFGETAMYRGATIDHGFTIAGRVWDMSQPSRVSLAGQALLDHYVGRMTASEDGANCGVITACESVEWHFVVIGNGEVQLHWEGEYFR